MTNEQANIEQCSKCGLLVSTYHRMIHVPGNPSLPRILCESCYKPYTQKRSRDISIVIITILIALPIIIGLCVLSSLFLK